MSQVNRAHESKGRFGNDRASTLVMHLVYVCESLYLVSIFSELEGSIQC